MTRFIGSVHLSAGGLNSRERRRNASEGIPHIPTSRMDIGSGLLRNIDDPNEVITLFELENVQKAREFSNSSDLRERMQEAGVADKPDIYLLSD